MKVKPRGIEIPLIILMIALSVFVLGAIGVVIYRLGQSGMFEQSSAAQTSVVRETTTTTAPETTAADTTIAEDATTAAESEEDKEAQKETEAETTTSTVKETEKAATDAAEEAEEPDEEKPDTTKKTDQKPASTKKSEQKTDNAKTEAKTTTTTAVEKKPEELYLEYVSNVLVPKYGLAQRSGEYVAEDGKGVASAMIRDFNNSGEAEMLVIRLEPYNSMYAVYPIVELYGIKNQTVTLISEVACQYAMSEWYIVNVGSFIYLHAVQEDVNASIEDVRIDEIEIDATRHSVMIVRDAYTTGSKSGPEKSYSMNNADWVCEVTNRVADESRSNEGRFYTMTDHSGLVDVIK